MVSSKSWRSLSFTGKKTRRVKCMRKDDKSAVADSVCEKGGLEKPEDEMPCNTQECPVEWVGYEIVSFNLLYWKDKHQFSCGTSENKSRHELWSKFNLKLNKNVSRISPKYTYTILPTLLAVFRGSVTYIPDSSVAHWVPCNPVVVYRVNFFLVEFDFFPHARYTTISYVLPPSFTVVSCRIKADQVWRKAAPPLRIYSLLKTYFIH